MQNHKNWIYRERIFICPPLKTTIFTITVVSQLLVRSHLTTRRVFKRHYFIGLTVLPIFLFSGVSYVLQKKRKKKEKKDLHYTDDSLGSDMNPRILNAGTSFFFKESAICTSVGIRDTCNFFSFNHFSQNSHLFVKSLIQNLG